MEKQDDLDILEPEIEGEIGVFLDRDGTINEAGPAVYITKWPDFKFIPGALEGIALLASLPVKIFIVTNQSAVYRGLMTAADVEHIHGMMEFEIVSTGGRIDGLKYCPHQPRDKCTCRKPSPLLFHELAREHAIDLKRSFNIGDSLRDMEAGARSEMINILVRSGQGKLTETDLVNQNVKVDYVVNDLKQAAEIISGLLCKDH